MKSSNLWERLVQSARGVLETSFNEMPYGFDTRVVAQWQAAAPVFFSYWFRRGAIIASLVMFFSAVATYQALKDGEPNELAVADTVLRFSIDYE